MAEIGTPKEKDATAALERAANNAIDFAVSYGKSARERFRREFGSKPTPISDQSQDYNAMQNDVDAWERLFRDRGLEAGVLWGLKMQKRGERGPL